jgi:uncharacterized cysteine cluster protein YcgN (CxxCxxCC family)
MDRMTPEEWEALCDGCGKCCLNKLEDEDTQEVALTRVACRLLDDQTCRCGQYEIRKTLVPECIRLTPADHGRCRLFHARDLRLPSAARGKPLYWWHPLVSGDPKRVHEAGISVRGITVPEWEVPEEDWEDYVIEEPGNMNVRLRQCRARPSGDGGRDARQRRRRDALRQRPTPRPRAPPSATLFEAPEAEVAFVATGTSANALALACLCSPMTASSAAATPISRRTNAPRRSSSGRCEADARGRRRRKDRRGRPCGRGSRPAGPGRSWRAAQAR